MMKCDECNKDTSTIDLNTVGNGKNPLILCNSCYEKLYPDSPDVIISPFKTYTREEVINLLAKFIENHPLERGIQILRPQFQEWIENNL